MPTPRLLIPLAVTLLVGVMLAGCLGGDDVQQPTDGDDDKPGFSATTGSIQGRVLTESLDPVKTGRVVLVKDQTIIDEQRTDAQGRYTMKDIEPGDYRIQFSAPCCNELVQAVTVEANQAVTVEVRLRVFTAADLQAPYMEPRDWTGLLACGVGTPVVTGAPCGDVDPNDDFLHHWDLPEGVQQIAIAVEWQAVGGVIGENLFIAVENRGCGLTACSQEYARESGSSPIIFTVSSPSGEWAFANIDGSREMQFRVFPDFEPGVYWQQPFTVHYHLFFHQDAPPGYSPLPDA